MNTDLNENGIINEKGNDNMSGLNYNDFKRKNVVDVVEAEFVDAEMSDMGSTQPVVERPRTEVSDVSTVLESDGRTFNEVQVRVSNQLSLTNKDVQAIIKKVDIGNPESVLLFGQDAAESISKFSDKILAETSKNTVQESGKMLRDLTALMKEFNPKDFIEEPKKRGMLSKMFKKMNTGIDGMLNKYQTMDKEIKNIFVQIKEYESEIKKSNHTMDTMYDKNVEYYEELEKYIFAGNELRNIAVNDWMPELKAKAEQTNDAKDLQAFNEICDFVDLMDNRIQDLEMAKMVSVQTAPQIKMIQKGNYNLMSKVNSAFVITLPTFKTGLVQAINIKKQKIAADDFADLDEHTNQMLIRNAQNISDNSLATTKLTGTPSIKMDTLEQTFDIIMKGIEETVALEEENRKEREVNRERLIELQEKIKSKNF